MRARFVDRWTDNGWFRGLHALTGVVVLPTLALGLVVAVTLLFDGGYGEEAVVFLALPIGGLIGVVGWLRAHWGAGAPCRHDLTLTLVMLGVGVLTALAVFAVPLGGFVAELTMTPRPSAVSLAVCAAVALCPFVWVLAGIGWMQRSVRLYALHTGMRFDALPALMLFVAVALAAAAALISIAI
jgi:hypothetical protein